MDYSSDHKGKTLRSRCAWATCEGRRFLKMYKRSFWSLLPINLICFITFLPIIGCFFAYAGDPALWIGERLFPLISGEVLRMMSQCPILLKAVSAILAVSLYGPFTAGMTWVTRELVCGSELRTPLKNFFNAAKKNIFGAVGAGMLDLLVFFGLMFYLAGEQEGYFASFFAAGRILAIPAGFLYLLARPYIYLILVTFEMSFRDVLRDGFIFAVAGLWENLLLALVSLIFILLSGLFDVVFLPFFLPAMLSLAASITSWPLICCYLLDEKEQTAL